MTSYILVNAMYEQTDGKSVEPSVFVTSLNKNLSTWKQYETIVHKKQEKSSISEIKLDLRDVILQGTDSSEAMITNIPRFQLNLDKNKTGVESYMSCKNDDIQFRDKDDKMYCLLEYGSIFGCGKFRATKPCSSFIDESLTTIINQYIEWVIDDDGTTWDNPEARILEAQEALQSPNPELFAYKFHTEYSSKRNDQLSAIIF